MKCTLIKWEVGLYDEKQTGLTVTKNTARAREKLIEVVLECIEICMYLIFFVMCNIFCKNSLSICIIKTRNVHAKFYKTAQHIFIYKIILAIFITIQKNFINRRNS